MSPQVETWLRGPVSGVDPTLVPAAHALQQTLEDVEGVLADLSPEQLWVRPGGAASVGFHVHHVTGSTDRLLTYARGEMLTEAQRARLTGEKQISGVEADELLAELRRTIDAALSQIRATPVSSLDEPRPIGRARLPTTVLGLIFHAAEHSQRHAGQIVTTAKIVRGLGSGSG